MVKITTIFSDVGGVLLTNGWDHPARTRCVERFRLDGKDFEDRHALVDAAFETGRMTLDDYLDRTIFYQPREFSKEAVRAFMFAQSMPLPASLEIVRRLAETRRYLMATLNNEARELNAHRIAAFGLKKYFTLFVSSCYLGVRKPEHAIFAMALDLTQRAPEECVFVDDRPLNVECAMQLGMKALLYQNPSQLERDLGALGVG